MGLFLSKILTQLSLPLGFGSFLLISGLFFRRTRFGLGVSGLGVLWIWLWSTPIFSDWIRFSLEKRYPPIPLTAVPRADAIIVLGGALGGAIAPRLFPDLSSAADRVWHAARLFHAGKAPWILLSGGRLPWRNEATPEADAMLQFLMDLGVPKERVLLEGGSATTRENAQETQRLLGEKHLSCVLLVTSALHMRRAAATFRGAGVSVIPVATDHEVVYRSFTGLDYLPDAEALAASSRAFKEYLGFWVYGLRGWIQEAEPVNTSCKGAR